MIYKNKDYNFQGLSELEVKKRLEKDGYNELTDSGSGGIFYLLFRILKEPMFILLVICSSLYIFLGDIEEGLMLLGFVFIVVAIEYYQSRKSEKAINALKNLSAPRALVIRDGFERRIAGRDIVVDDIIVLQEGDRVPADAVILKCMNLHADESMLTGESVAVRKSEWNNNTKIQSPGGDDLSYVFSGTMIVSGMGIAQVLSTGDRTYMGRIGSSISGVKDTPTRLSFEIKRLVKWITLIGIVLCALITLTYYFTRGDIIKGFLSGITLAMAILPEEYPVVFSVFMAIGAWRLSKINVLVRKTAAIEALGSVSVLCTDKTGTLTENKMRVEQLYNGKTIWYNNDSFLTGDFHEIIEYGILSSQINPFDPMEKAINNVGDAFLQGTEHIHSNWEMLKEYSLSKDLMAMSRVFYDSSENKIVVASKGAPEAIFDLCHLSESEIEKYKAIVEHMAEQGLRVLGVAKSEFVDFNLPKIQHDFVFRFAGLIGLSDPIRSSVPNAVKECQSAGIRVKMITGDYPVTAKNIAEKIGLINYSECITGDELNDMSDEKLQQIIPYIDVFARILPEQKLKIVEALKANKEVVVMTGDGVNDAPALKAAQVGIAMGEKGTDVARESAAIVLLDDNFGSIEKAIKMGRKIFDNLQKSLTYIFAIHIPVIGLTIVPIIFKMLPIVLWPIHIVFMELIINPACSLIFESEPEDINVMRQKPKSVNEPFFGRKNLFLAFFQGLSILVVVLLIYFSTLSLGYEKGIIRAMTFATLIIANIATIESNRSKRASIFRIFKRKNRMNYIIVTLALLLLFTVLAVPGLCSIFQFSVINIWQALLTVAAGCSTIVFFEIYKFILRKKENREQED